MYVICREGPPTSCLSDPLPPLINVPIPSAFLFSLTLHTHYCRKDPYVVSRMAPNAFSDEFGDTSSDSPYLVTNLVMNFANLVNKNKSQHRLSHEIGMISRTASRKHVHKTICKVYIVSRKQGMIRDEIVHTDINQHQQQHEHRSIGESNYPKLLLYSTTTHKYWGREANPTSNCCIR